MSDDRASARPEIVIIRRKGADDGAAVKGGAWKIAYADFVTAMMAFFLVMWLINASNEATRAQVASYFNPIKLTDTSTGNKGMTEPKEALHKEGSSNAPAILKEKDESEEPEHEEKLLSDPQTAIQKVLAEAGQAASPSPVPPSIEGGATTSEASAESPGLGDPFDPRSWEHVPETPAKPTVETPDVRTTVKDERAMEPQHIVPDPVVENPAPEPTHGIADPAPVQQVETPPREAPESVESRAVAEMRSEEILEKIRQKLTAAGSDAAALAGLEVTAIREGTLISLTDRQAVGMFRSGSAEPEAATVALIDAIAQVLANEQGNVIVRGHTDAKPYLNLKYDNWQLSTARAHMAQYMLVHGGLPEGRIQRIEGVADRALRVPDDPGAPENRRIEILLERLP